MPYARMTVLTAGLVGIAAYAFAGESPGGKPVAAKLIRVKRIWDKAPHNAFTDLIRYKDRFYCAFREGRSHASTDGRIRVLASDAGDTWESAALIKWPKQDTRGPHSAAAPDGPDLRDANLATAPDGRLMLVGGIADRKKDRQRTPTGSFACFTTDGRSWTEPKMISKPGRWLWRVTAHGGKVWGVAYRAYDAEGSSLLVSDDGVAFRTVVERLLAKGWPTEAVLRFDEDGTLYCLHRRDSKKPAERTAYLGVCKPDYAKGWTWHDLGRHLGGPALIHTPHGWIAGGRQGGRMALLALDVEKGAMTELLTLPSGGDCSYPGLAWHDGALWVSYYASHERKTSIYFAKVALE